MNDNASFPSGKERRQHPRHKGVIVEYALVKYTKDKEAPELKSAMIRDISLGGVSIFVSEQIDAGERLLLRLYSSHSDIPVIAVGDVVWARRSNELPKDHFNLGIEFSKLDKKNKERLSEMIQIFDKLEHTDEEEPRSI